MLPHHPILSVLKNSCVVGCLLLFLQASQLTLPMHSFTALPMSFASFLNKNPINVSDCLCSLANMFHVLGHTLCRRCVFPMIIV